MSAALTQHPAREESAAAARKRLGSWLRRQRRWFALVADYQAGLSPYPSLRLLPSKDSKHRAYADGATLVRLYAITSGGQPFHPRTMDDLVTIHALTDPKRWS